MKRVGTILLAGAAALLLVPAFLRSSPLPQLGSGVVVMTPHNEQIRFELGSRFSQWHKREFGTDAHVAWSTPGGTSEIRKLLQSQWKAAASAGVPYGGDIDLVFGGGSYEHGVLAKPTQSDDPESTISFPHGFSTDELSSWFSSETIADGRLYDEQSYWIGTALSSFGLIWNEDEFDQLGLPRPTDWSMLAHPKLRGRVAFVNPAMSGSVTTALQSILEHLGWQRGWALIRRASANARSISGSSSRVPGDVGAGEAAIGPCIDFYGRAQVAALEAAGISGRIKYRDAAGQTVVDADPISLLRGAPNPELAKRFIRFCLTTEAQALWQLPPSDPDGPERFALRRLPIRAEVYEHLGDRMLDQVDPFSEAQVAAYPNRAARAFIVPLFLDRAVDHRDELREAWQAIVEHPAYPATDGVVMAADVDDPELRLMLQHFDALPSVPMPNDTMADLNDPETLAAVKAGWLREGFLAMGWWDLESNGTHALQGRASTFFLEQYQKVVNP